MDRGKKDSGKRNRIAYVLAIIALLLLLSLLLAGIIGFLFEDKTGNTALIKISGPVTVQPDGFSKSTSAEDIVGFI
ncbi:MAG: hypothetical protein N3D84_02785, partial [Candidatus Woesearchaeota archaeon]|nr:hypothetical protein [Candidatus Woesearchaeota archaeon]